MITPYDNAQRIVLRGTNWEEARHLVLSFGELPAPAHFLHLLKRNFWPTAAGACKPQEPQVSLGFSRRGLERAFVPKHVLVNMALKAPAFHAGAALRANRYLGLSGRDGPGSWDPSFSFTTLDALISLHGTDKDILDQAVVRIDEMGRNENVQIRQLLPARRLEPHPGETDPKATWAHFGFRDGLAHIGIKGWTPPKTLGKSKSISQYEAGEFLLGHAQRSGANPWIGADRRIWPAKLRNFFRNGSFGVFHQIEQHVAAFEDFVQARPMGLAPAEIRAKLCGRHPDGRPLAAAQNEPGDDFDYTTDEYGYLCPFGSHVRRMNPRNKDLPHATRARPLIRRGMPYGAAVWGKAGAVKERRGLLGQFFCASIEDQYEHLIGQWADRVPLGSADRGGARDPLFGAHEPGDGPFQIPQGKDKQPIVLEGLLPFTQTIGVAYLFYPSLAALQGIAEMSRWYEPDEDNG